jgi:hypothetical protein
MEHKMDPKMECSEPISLYINYDMDDTGIQYLWDLYFEHIDHVEYINTLHGKTSEPRNIAIHGNYISESEHRKIRLGSKLPPNYQGNFSERNATTHVMSDMFKYLYKQTKEQAKTIDLLTERMNKQEELLQEQSLKLEQYINGEEVIVLKKGVFKPK